MKDVALEYAEVKPIRQYTESMKKNIKEITDSEDLMKSFLVC
jgi:hypothetical protein